MSLPAPGAPRLATRAGAAGDFTILAAEQGAALLGGQIAPARRVFLFLEDTSYLVASDAGRTIMENALAWATNFRPPCAPDFDGDGFVTGLDFDGFVSAFESGDPIADYD